MNKITVSLLGLLATLSATVSANADFTIRSLATGRCLGVRSASGSDGAEIVTYTCDGSLNQTWQFSSPWPVPNNMFNHVLNRVHGATATDRCLAYDTAANPKIATSAACINTSADAARKGWWPDYAGMYTVPGVVGERVCFTLKSKVDSATYLTGTGGHLAQPYVRTAAASPLPSTQIWCQVN